MANSVNITLTGEPDQLQSVLSELSNDFEGLGDVSDETADEIGGGFSAAFSGLVSAAKTAFDVIMAGLGKLKDTFTDAFAAFSIQEQAETKIESVLAATENRAGYSKDKILELASALQSVTTIGDEESLEAISSLLSFEQVKGDQLSEVLELSADLSTIFGGSLQGNAKLLGRALEDPVSGMNSLRRANILFSDEQKATITALQASGDMAGAQAIILEEAQGKVGGAARNAADTASGGWTQIMNDLGDVKEELFRAVLPIFALITPIVKKAVTQLARLMPYIAEYAAKFAEYLGPALEWLEEAVLYAFTAVEVTIKNSMAVVTLISANTALALVVAWNEVYHFFTVVMPAGLVWFADNWTNILSDLASVSATIFTNMSENIYNFFGSVKSWLSGDEFDFKWTGLTEGFESSISELPIIAARQRSALEIELANMAVEASDSFGKSFNEELEENRNAWNQSGKAVDPSDIGPDMEVIAETVANGPPIVFKADFIGLEDLGRQIQLDLLGGEDQTEDVAGAVHDSGQLNAQGQQDIVGAVVSVEAAITQLTEASIAEGGLD